MRYVLLLAMLLAGCVQKSPTEPIAICPDKSIQSSLPGQIEQPAYAAPLFVWKKNPVQFCWETENPKYDDDKFLVEETIEVGWLQFINLDVVWKSNCSVGDDFHIQILDVRPNSSVGDDNQPSYGVMQLNFDLNNWCSGGNRGDCIVYEANHEFGHAIGFLHEQDRPDAPKDQNCQSTGETNPVLYKEYGPYDPHSVMNYCSTSIWPDCEDIATAQLFYNR